MDWIIVLQAISVVILALIGLVRSTFDPEKKKLTLLGRILLVAGSLAFISTAIIKESETRNAEDRIRQQTEEIRLLNTKIDTLINRLFSARVDQVMETPKTSSPTFPQEPAAQIRITSPLDGSAVPARPYLEGTVSDPRAKVWVIVHPMETGAYWIQPTVNVREDGAWQNMLYLGRSGDIDIGKHFEIMVIANPKETLNEADVLSEWPDAQWKSPIIGVTRR